MRSIEQSPVLYARVAGLIYLAIILLGAFGEMYVRGSLITPDAQQTLSNIAAAHTLWRASIATDLAMHVLDIPLIVIMYYLLRPVSRELSVLATLFNIVQTAILAANKLTLLVPLAALDAGGAGNAESSQSFAAAAYLAVSMHGYGFATGLIFFGFACLVRGALMYTSGYFPRWLGTLLALGGLIYLVNSAALILAPDLASLMFPFILLPALIGEFSVCLWLLAKGVRRDAWDRRIAEQAARAA
jgi:hypothetical protein